MVWSGGRDSWSLVAHYNYCIYLLVFRVGSISELLEKKLVDLGKNLLSFKIKKGKKSRRDSYVSHLTPLVSFKIKNSRVLGVFF